jgi:predicted nucleic acid-binding protein
MVRLAIMMVGSQSTAEDLTQDAYTKLYARFAKIDDPHAYLRTAVVNGCRGRSERSDPAKGAILRNWLDATVVPAFGERILAVDEAVAIRSAALHLPDPAPYRDAFIGATALIHGMTIVTSNTADFLRVPGVKVLNPWT